MAIVVLNIIVIVVLLHLFYFGNETVVVVFCFFLWLIYFKCLFCIIITLLLNRDGLHPTPAANEKNVFMQTSQISKREI